MTQVQPTIPHLRHLEVVVLTPLVWLQVSGHWLRDLEDVQKHGDHALNFAWDGVWVVAVQPYD